MSNSTADILRKAKAHISDPKDWFKGEFCPTGCWYDAVNGVKPCCMEGAIGFAGGDTMNDNPEYQFVKKAVGTFPCGFNDDPETTHADVMSAFDRAIALAEAEAAK